MRYQEKELVQCFETPGTKRNVHILDYWLFANASAVMWFHDYASFLFFLAYFLPLGEVNYLAARIYHTYY